MKPAVFSRKALRELRSAVEEYDRQREGRGTTFELAVRDALRFLGEHPKAGRPLIEGFRKRVASRFPYLIYYLEYDAYLWIASVYHGSRDPLGWNHADSNDPPPPT